MMRVMSINPYHTEAVMAGHSRLKDGVATARLCPAIHALTNGWKDVDARHKAGHDDAARPLP
jgi:hypothetical protein